MVHPNQYPPPPYAFFSSLFPFFSCLAFCIRSQIGWPGLLVYTGERGDALRAVTVGAVVMWGVEVLRKERRWGEGRCVFLMVRLRSKQGEGVLSAFWDGGGVWSGVWVWGGWGCCILVEYL